MLYLIFFLIECPKAPEITMNPESVSSDLYSKVILECQASGCPHPTITWYKDNQAILTGSTLVIPAVVLSDRGFYACKAINSYGNASSSEAKVSIKGY